MCGRDFFEEESIAKTLTPENLSGLRVGRFLILERLGAGGMGVVYRAHDERLDRDIALKVLPPGVLADERARLRFRREALALSRLNHPNIETVHDFDTRDGIDYLVIELVPGETVAQKLAAGPLPEREVCRLGEQMSDALRAAHERGVIHRDLKPGNLCLTTDGRLKILDFGIAKLFDAPQEIFEATTITRTELPEPATDRALPVAQSFQTRGLVGTLPYMSPEQITGSGVDARTDIYSAGAVLYEMCSGQLPFVYTDDRRLIDAILHDSPIPPTKIAEVSKSLEAIIMKALQKDQAHRHQSAGELLADLRKLGTTSHPRTSKIDSIAVLPFESQNPDIEYLSDGITETLIYSLSELPSMKKVIAWGSVFRYKGRQVLPEEVGRELNVRAVLTGKVAQRGDKTVITAELVDSVDARHLWGRRCEWDVAVVPDVEQEIANDISATLKLRLGRRPEKAGSRHQPEAEAFRLYLKGRYFWNRRPAAGTVQKAIEHFGRAAKRDPDFALAHVGLADCYNALGRWESGAMAPRIAFPRAKTAASGALRVDSTVAEAHSAMAYVRMHYDWDWAGAEEGFQRALKLNSNCSHAHHWYAHYLVTVGRIDEALAESFRILELDPLDVIINIHLAWHYYLTHQFDKAADASRKALELEPHSHWGYFFLGWAYEQMNRLQAAIDALEKSLELSGGSTVMKAALGHAYGLAGDRSRAFRVIEELEQQSRTQYISSYEIGLIYAAMKDADEVFVRLERAFEERSGWLPYLNAEPRLAHMHSDPRFMSLVKRLGLPCG